MSIHDLLNNGQFAARAPLADIVKEFERARGAPLSLEDKLKLSVAENDARKAKQVQHEDLYAAIEKRRSELLESLHTMRGQREELNGRIKDAQDALDALPVPKTRRAKKPRELPEHPSEGV